MSYVTLHTNLMHPCHLIDVNVLCQQFQVVHSFILAHLSRWRRRYRALLLDSLIHRIFKEVHVCSGIKPQIFRRQDSFAGEPALVDRINAVFLHLHLFTKCFGTIQVILRQRVLVTVQEQVLLVLPRFSHQRGISQPFVLKTVPLFV